MRTALAAALILAVCLGARANAQTQPATADTTRFYQAYLDRLVEEWRLEQVRALAQQWGVTVVGIKELGINRGFWEKRLIMRLSLGLPAGRKEQNLVLEYQYRPKLIIRGELNRQSARSDAWLDFIFRTEY